MLEILTSEVSAGPLSWKITGKVLVNLGGVKMVPMFRPNPSPFMYPIHFLYRDILCCHLFEAENESLCLGLSFAAIRSISFFAIGAMPDTHFHVYADVENADWHRGWMVPWKF